MGFDFHQYLAIQLLSCSTKLTLNCSPDIAVTVPPSFKFLKFLSKSLPHDMCTVILELILQLQEPLFVYLAYNLSRLSSNALFGIHCDILKPDVQLYYTWSTFCFYSVNDYDFDITYVYNVCHMRRLAWKLTLNNRHRLFAASVFKSQLVVLKWNNAMMAFVVCILQQCKVNIGKRGMVTPVMHNTENVSIHPIFATS